LETLIAILKHDESNKTIEGFYKFVPKGNWKLTLKAYNGIDENIAQITSFLIFR
jgi:hypothetical protein